jgi:hypothetical protein
MTASPHAIVFGGSSLKTFTFEGKDFVIQFHPEIGSLATLADLCEIHWCGRPSDVLPLLQQCGGGSWDVDELADFADDPGDVLVNLDADDLMATIRAQSADWQVAARFREWLIATVFHTSSHRERDETTWARIAEWRAKAEAAMGYRPCCESADEVREWRWQQELKDRPKPRLVH